MTVRLSSRAWILVGAIVGLLVLIAAWLVVISPARSDASQLRDDAASVRTQNTVIMARNNKLRDQAKHKQQLVAELTAALQGLPSGAGLPVFSRQLASQALAQRLVLTGVTIGAATALATSTAAATTMSDTTATTADAAPTSPSTATTSGPMSIPVTVTTDGPALQQLLFLRDVQQVGPRLVLVTSSSLAPSSGAGNSDSIDASSTMTLQLTVFTNPLPKATRERLAQLTGAADGPDGQN